MEILRGPGVKGIILMMNFVEFIEEFDLVEGAMCPVEEKVIH